MILLVDLNVDDLFKKVRARLQGVDTPDAFKSTGDTEAGRVRAEVRRITKGRQCRIDVHAQGRGGWKVTLFVLADDLHLNLNEKLRKDGFVFEQKEPV